MYYKRPRDNATLSIAWLERKLRKHPSFATGASDAASLSKRFLATEGDVNTEIVRWGFGAFSSPRTKVELMPGLDYSMTGRITPAIVGSHMLTFLHGAYVIAAERQDAKVLTDLNEPDRQVRTTLAGAM